MLRILRPFNYEVGYVGSTVPHKQWNTKSHHEKRIFPRVVSISPRIALNRAVLPDATAPMTIVRLPAGEKTQLLCSVIL